jgi:hypothetical protein
MLSCFFIENFDILMCVFQTFFQWETASWHLHTECSFRSRSHLVSHFQSILVSFITLCKKYVKPKRSNPSIVSYNAGIIAVVNSEAIILAPGFTP